MYTHQHISILIPHLRQDKQRFQTPNMKAETTYSLNWKLGLALLTYPCLLPEVQASTHKIPPALCSACFSTASTGRSLAQGQLLLGTD